MCHFVLVFSVLLVLRLPRLGNRELIVVLFIRLFDLCLFRFVGFLFLLGSGKGCGTPWTFLLFFLIYVVDMKWLNSCDSLDTIQEARSFHPTIIFTDDISKTDKCFSITSPDSRVIE